MARLKTRTAEWATACLALPGQIECGDKHFIAAVPDGNIVAVVDGVGHGDEAAAAADRALQVIDQWKTQTLPELARRCDEALRGTRGVAMALAAFNADDRTMTWLGIGNVAGHLRRRAASTRYPHETLLQRPGLVGDQRLPQLQSASVRITRGDVAVLATDGIDPNFIASVDVAERVEQIAETVMAAHRNPSDDALVFVIRYLG